MVYYHGRPMCKCSECKFAKGYHAMYVGDDYRKWGTSLCTRLKRHKRVHVLSDTAGCEYGIKANRRKKWIAV